MPKQVTIGALSFPSKKAAYSFFRQIRDSWGDDVEIHGIQDQHLREMVSAHPEAKAKIGAGISHFTVTRDKRFRTTRHFQIHRLDGSSTDVSFKSPIDGRNDRRDRLEALRSAIEPQILAFRRQRFADSKTHTCPLRGIDITQDSYHVDHQAPNTFQRLVKQWLEAEGMEIEDVQITPPQDNQITTSMTDHHQLESWRLYHSQNATLRLLSPLGNLSDARTR